MVNRSWEKYNVHFISFEQTRSLQPIDEMVLFLNYLALGSKQHDLAERYGVHQSTVSRIITTWSNFLYTVLGSVRIWIPEEKIRAHLPADFKDYADTTVILDCTELRCQCPSSPLLQSEMFSVYKSHCTLKGLLGVAPHGAVTFISPIRWFHQWQTDHAGVWNSLPSESWDGHHGRQRFPCWWPCALQDL